MTNHVGVSTFFTNLFQLLICFIVVSIQPPTQYSKLCKGPRLTLLLKNTELLNDLIQVRISNDAHQQVFPGIHIPLVPCDGEVFDLHHYHPCTKLQGPPL